MAVRHRCLVTVFQTYPFDTLSSIPRDSPLTNPFETLFIEIHVIVHHRGYLGTFLPSFHLTILHRCLADFISSQSMIPSAPLLQITLTTSNVVSQNCYFLSANRFYETYYRLIMKLLLPHKNYLQDIHRRLIIKSATLFRIISTTFIVVSQNCCFLTTNYVYDISYHLIITILLSHKESSPHHHRRLIEFLVLSHSKPSNKDHSYPMMVHKASSHTAFIVVLLSKWNSLMNHLARHSSSSLSKIAIFLAQNHLQDGPCHLIELLFSCNSPSRHSSMSR